jgi:inorganic pyrophosphatase
MMDQNFWNYLERLIAACPLVIDRPKGSRHPRYPDVIYPLDYGYLAGSTTIDGGGLDVWVGTRPERTLAALALTVDLYKRDAEIKLLLGCTGAGTEAILDFFNNSDSMRAVLVPR